MAQCNEWANYETWNYHNWLDNDQESRNELIAQAKKTSNPVDNLAIALKNHIEESIPEVTGVYADLLQSCIDSIDYQEIAFRLIFY
ncbi:MAG: hypothetical protein ACK55Q_21275 [Dolichospermum sp.]|jgi:hypothetical protein